MYKSLVRDSTVDSMSINDRLDIAYNFDFNQGLKEGQTTFEYKFMANHCNVLGEIYSPQAAHIVITEFRKYMAIISNKISLLKYN